MVVKCETKTTWSSAFWSHGELKWKALLLSKEFLLLVISSDGFPCSWNLEISASAQSWMKSFYTDQFFFPFFLLVGVLFVNKCKTWLFVLDHPKSRGLLQAKKWARYCNSSYRQVVVSHLRKWVGLRSHWVSWSRLCLGLNHMTSKSPSKFYYFVIKQELSKVCSHIYLV